MPKNLLPNASFELDFGEGLCTNWGDLQNELTLPLSLTGQQEHTPPCIEARADAVDGEYAARLTLDPAADGGAVGHLTSPVVAVKPGQVYTLSVYARSDEPSARLELGLWTRPLDFRQRPSRVSQPRQLSTDWVQYQFTLVTDELEDRAVADLTVYADQAGAAHFDAVQLEEGPRPTEFETRWPVEVALRSRRRNSLHLAGEPFELSLTAYNSTDEPVEKHVEMTIASVPEGVQVFEHAESEPVPPGRQEGPLRLDFSLVGAFRARVYEHGGRLTSVDDHLFSVHPVIKRDFQGIPYSRHGELQEPLPAERVWLPWANEKSWYADPPAGLTVTDADAIYVTASDGTSLLRTRDGGRTWDVLEVECPVLTVLRNGALVGQTVENGDVVLYRSTDEGRTFQPLSRLAGLGSVQVGPITELADGALIWPIGRDAPEGHGPSIVYAYRSADGGATWSEGSPICPGGEPQIAELASGRLLAAVRNNPSLSAADWRRAFANEMPWRLWMRAFGFANVTSYTKRIMLADSDDHGLTWNNVRPGTFLLDEMHGQALPLPDDRVVLLYTHRGPWPRGGERAKVSRDQGQTWAQELYYLNATPAYPGYSASCVLPPHLADGEPNMILSVVGERSERIWGHPGTQPTSEGIEMAPRMQAIRWRPLP